MADAPLLITVEQLGLDLVVEAKAKGSGAVLSVDAGDHGWGTEVLVLEAPDEHQIKVRPKDRYVGQAHYRIEAEALPASPDERSAALSLTSRAGQEAFTRTLESRRRAVALYREALAAWHSLGESRWEAEALYAIAALERANLDLSLAEEDFQKALALWRELDEPQIEASTLNGLGITHTDMGKIEDARKEFQSALALWQRLGEPFEEVETSTGLCALKQLSGALPDALTCYEEMRARFSELGYGKEETKVLNSIGGVYDGLGQPDDALDHYQQVLARWREMGERLEEARTLNNMGVVHRALGEWQEALRLYDQAGEILATLDDRSLEAARLNNVGFAYRNLGEPERALRSFEQALKLRQETGGGRGEVIARNNLGETWRKLGDPDKALGYHRQALELATKLKDSRQEAISRLRLGEAQLDQGNAAAVLDGLGPALAYFHTTGNRRYEAQVIDLRGRALTLAGRPQEALPVVQEALDLHRTLRNRPDEAEALRALAATERALGLRDKARTHAEEAVAAVEALRTGFVSPDLRAAFLATQRRAYALLIDLLMDRHAADPKGGYDRAALAVSERARARSLLDVLLSKQAGRRGASVPAELLERRQSLRRRLSSMTFQQLMQSGEKAEALGRDIEKLLTQLDNVEAETRRLDSLYAVISNPPTLGVEQIARLLDRDTLLLEYSLGEERSYLWEIEAGAFRSFILPPQREIETLARQLYEKLSTNESGTGRRTEAAEALSRILLGQKGSGAMHGKRLVVVPDGVLHILPFSALPASGSGDPLLEKLEIAYVPSATTLDLQRQRLEKRAPAAQWAAVIADPVFKSDDPRLSSLSAVDGLTAEQPAVERSTLEIAPLSNLERLPATRREADKIVSLAPAGKVWAVHDLGARRDEVLSGKLRDYRFVHFATHGLADTLYPERSGLVLSLVDSARQPQEGFVSLSDIYELDLDADLVVLSGCRTALGKEVRGEGIMGLTRGFLYAGVPRVVASLWKVQDRTTAELMDRFYQALWKDRLPAAAALRKAQQSLRRDPRYGNPYSWAGFVLQGDWR